MKHKDEANMLANMLAINWGGGPKIHTNKEPKSPVRCMLVGGGEPRTACEHLQGWPQSVCHLPTILHP
jgi:hypothetical protein